VPVRPPAPRRTRKVRPRGARKLCEAHHRRKANSGHAMQGRDRHQIALRQWLRPTRMSALCHTLRPLSGHPGRRCAQTCQAEGRRWVLRPPAPCRQGPAPRPKLAATTTRSNSGRVERDPVTASTGTTSRCPNNRMGSSNRIRSSAVRGPCAPDRPRCASGVRRQAQQTALRCSGGRLFFVATPDVYFLPPVWITIEPFAMTCSLPLS
jgi:hypothetical protein